MPAAAEQLPGRPAETCRLNSPAVQEALGINDQLLPGKHGISAGWRDRAQAGHTIGPFGRDTGPGATIWSWLRWLLSSRYPGPASPRSADQALAEVAEPAEAQESRRIAAAEPVLKLAEAGGFSGELQQASARPQQPRALGCLDFSSFSNFSNSVHGHSCCVARQEALVAAHRPAPDTSRQTSRRMVPFTLTGCSSRSSQP